MYYGINISSNYEDTYDIEIFFDNLDIVLSISEEKLRKLMNEIKNVLDELD